MANGTRPPDPPNRRRIRAANVHRIAYRLASRPGRRPARQANSHAPRSRTARPPPSRREGPTAEAGFLALRTPRRRFSFDAARFATYRFYQSRDVPCGAALCFLGQIDKGKPIARSGRKAMGLARRVRQAAEIATTLSLFSRRMRCRSNLTPRSGDRSCRRGVRFYPRRRALAGRESRPRTDRAAPQLGAGGRPSLNSPSSRHCWCCCCWALSRSVER